MKTFHFIGIGGIGMSGIARVTLERGHRVQGSDAKNNQAAEDLSRRGAKIFIGHDASYVEGADVVVYSSAIPAAHPERVEAVCRGIPVMHRSEALAALCEDRSLIAVTGTHGKTTTTALVGMILKEARLDPSVVVGGWIADFGGNALSGAGPHMVIEADESDASFLRYSPSMALITNIEEEHLDHFGSLAQIEKAYEDFLRRMVAPARWFGCAEDPRVLALSKIMPPAKLYALKPLEKGLWAKNIKECPEGRIGASFEVWDGKEKLGSVATRLMGHHNVLNALGALAVGQALGIDFPVMASALARYGGAGRRFDVKYEDGTYLVVDDYAHHPTEILRTLEAARGLGKNRIVALFQPHRYSRTEFLMESFGKSFGIADKLILTDIYAASESPRPGITGKKLAEAVRRSGHPDVVFASRESLADVARSQIRPGDLVLVMGAGDISQVATQLSECLRCNGTFQRVFSGVRGKVLRNELLSKHTTLKVGGPAEFWAEPADEEDLSYALQEAFRHGLRVTVFGAGSNVLPPDEGIRGLAIHLGAAYFREIRREGRLLLARAGAPNTVFIQRALEEGFGGFEFLLGIPGNIGGALAMNAGSHGQSISSFVERVRTVDLSGMSREHAGSEVPFGYRSCGLQKEIFMEASFIFPETPREQVQKKLDEYRQHRVTTQDLRHPSAGCMFKNPEIPGCSSGKLIDQAGLKGLSVGKAQVSPIHANFLVNLGGATSRDIRQLIERVRGTVREKTGIELETEVKILESNE